MICLLVLRLCRVIRIRFSVMLVMLLVSMLGVVVMWMLCVWVWLRLIVLVLMLLIVMILSVVSWFISVVDRLFVLFVMML